MVEALVEALEVIEGQVRDFPRVAARIDAIGRVGQQVVEQGPALEAVWVGVHALHLVEHYTLEGQRLILLLDLIVPTFLCQDARIFQCPRV